MTVELKTPEQVAAAFTQIGRETAESERLANAEEFQALMTSRGYEPGFVSILSKLAAGTWTATETADALDVFLKDEDKTGEKDGN